MFFLDAELDNDASRDQKKSATHRWRAAFVARKKSRIFLQMSRKNSKISNTPNIPTGGSALEISDRSMLLASTRRKFRVGPLTEILKVFEIFHTRNRVSIFTDSLPRLHRLAFFNPFPSNNKRPLKIFECKMRGQK